MNLFPLLFNVYLSFTNADLSGGAVQAVGARNYTLLFSQAKYANALTTTALFVLLSVSIELVLGFVLALALRDRVPGKPRRPDRPARPDDALPGRPVAVLEPDPERPLRRLESAPRRRSICRSRSG